MIYFQVILTNPNHTFSKEINLTFGLTYHYVQGDTNRTVCTEAIYTLGNNEVIETDLDKFTLKPKPSAGEGNDTPEDDNDDEPRRGE